MKKIESLSNGVSHSKEQGVFFVALDNGLEVEYSSSGYLVYYLARVTLPKGTRKLGILVTSSGSGSLIYYRELDDPVWGYHAKEYFTRYTIPRGYRLLVRKLSISLVLLNALTPEELSELRDS
jgi:hypothetical protein